MGAAVLAIAAAAGCSRPFVHARTDPGALVASAGATREPMGPEAEAVPIGSSPLARVEHAVLAPDARLAYAEATAGPSSRETDSFGGPGHGRRNPRSFDPFAGRQVGFTSFGFHAVAPQDEARDRLDPGFGLSTTIGIFAITEPIAVGFETAGLFSWHDADEDFELEQDDFFAVRAMLGGRLAWFGAQATVVPYVRGGWMYRWDEGEGDFEENGPGFYLGGGLDFTVMPGLSIAPQILFTSAELGDEDIDTEETVFGVEFHINY